ncbi:MAG: FecR family protein [Azospirillaceae bacterium]
MRHHGNPTHHPLTRRLLLGAVPALALGPLLARSLPPARAEEAVVARIQSMDGSAAVIRGELRIDAVPGLPLTLLDVIITAGASRLELLFVDGSTVIIGPEARLSLDAFEIDGGSGQRENGAITIMNGAVRAVVEPGLGENFTIRGQSAVASVRGTEYAVIEEENRTSVLVLDGEVAVLDPDAGWTVTLGSGDGVDVPHEPPPGETEEPPPVNRWGQARIDQVLALTRRPVG